MVPLTMPVTAVISATSSDSRSTLMTGMAAHAEASKRSSAPASSAAASSSGPWRDSSCLLAVTTEAPRAIAVRR